jgi:hypothetical protein
MTNSIARVTGAYWQSAAAAQFREKLGHWPEWNWNSYALKLPDPATLAWVKSRLIAFAKRKVAP